MQDNLNYLDHRILILGPAWVGDMVMAQPLFMLLKERFPDCQIDVVAPKSTGALLDRMPEINEKIILPLAHGELGLSVRYKLAKVLRQKKYTQAVVLPNSFKSACLPFLAIWFIERYKSIE